MGLAFLVSSLSKLDGRRVREVVKLSNITTFPSPSHDVPIHGWEHPGLFMETLT